MYEVANWMSSSINWLFKPCLYVYYKAYKNYNTTNLNLGVCSPRVKPDFRSHLSPIADAIFRQRKISL